MSQKRKRTETTEGVASAPKSFKKHRASKPGQSNEQSKQRPRFNISHDDENGRSTNALKGRIRDLKRLLAHIDNVPKHKMSAGARQERERELQACEHEVAEKIAASREAEYRKKMIGKYHQVRFFDRQKGTRILKRLKKELSTLEDDTKKAKLQQKIHNAQVDVNYAMYYPLMKPYSALYPKPKTPKKSKDDSDDDEEEEDSKTTNGEVDGPKGNIEMWNAVESAMEEGTLDVLRNSKDTVPAAPLKKSKATLEKWAEKSRLEKKEKAKTAHYKTEGEKAYAARQEAEESDGGFFE